MATKGKAAEKTAKKQAKSSKSKKAKAEKKAKEPKAKKKAAKAPPIEARRGWLMNAWERWLTEFFAGCKKQVTQLELVQLIDDFVTENEGPEDHHSVIRNSIRRLVRDGWVERVDRGKFKAAKKLKKLKKKKTALGKEIAEARTEKGHSQKAMAGFLGHRSKGRYATLEQGRTHMYAWEAHSIGKVLGIDVVE
jgi:hypothetical protein